MSLRRRVKAMEQRFAPAHQVLIPVFLHGGNHDHARERLEYAREHGYRVRLIRFSVGDVADSLEQAEEIVANHRTARPNAPITIYRRGSDPEEVLARWDQGFPEWATSPKAEGR